MKDRVCILSIFSSQFCSKLLNISSNKISKHNEAAKLNSCYQKWNIFVLSLIQPPI